MSLGDTIGYFIFGNPFSQALISTASSVVQSIGDLTPRKITAPQVQAPIPHICLPLSKLAGRDYLFVRLAGVSGAFAVIMGAYGKYILARIADPKDQLEAKTVFETASRFHFLNTFALMAMPLAKKPFVTGLLMTVGTLLFSGPMYYRALTGDKTFVQVATFGGFVLISAWLSLVV